MVATVKAGLAEVLRRHGSAFLTAHPLSGAKAKVWRAILACRTAALGVHVQTCDACDATRHVYHSCRNRHCPRCQTRAKEAWLAVRQREVLRVPYFHLVFTVPHDLNRLIGQCSRSLYETLFGAVSATLTEFAANPRWLGGTPAFTLVLHTWKQDLGRRAPAYAGAWRGTEGRWQLGGGQTPVSISGQGAVSRVSREICRRPEAGTRRRETGGVITRRSSMARSARQGSSA